MDNCVCQKSGLRAGDFIGIIFGIISGIIVGILFSLGLIPITLNFITISIIMSVVSLAILLFTLFTANITKGNNPFYKCICRYGRLLLAGVVGSFLSNTIALIIGVTVITTAATVFVALSALFFVIMIIAVVSLILCLIKQTCRLCDE